MRASDSHAIAHPLSSQLLLVSCLRFIIAVLTDIFLAVYIVTFVIFRLAAIVQQSHLRPAPWFVLTLSGRL